MVQDTNDKVMERINPTEHRVERKKQKGAETLRERQREEDFQCWREDKKLGWWTTV